MPIYEYQCQGCGHNFEALVPRVGGTPGQCPACGEKRLQKQFSTFSARVSSSSASGDSCPVASACPSGGCCGGGGSCPF